MPAANVPMVIDQGEDWTTDVIWTDNFDEVRRVIAAYWPERVEKLTGKPEQTLIDSARLQRTAGRAMVLTARGPEQQAQGVNNTLAYINLALAKR